MAKQIIVAGLAFAITCTVGSLLKNKVVASDHDDGENAVKNRALNLTDHLAWRDDADTSMLNLYMYVNPRSLPATQYDFQANARYEFHVTKVTDKKAAPTGADDYTFRFAFAAADSAGNQAITLSVLSGGNLVGTGTGATTNYTNSKTNTVASRTVNSNSIGGTTYKYFAGMRQDTFFFDVNRFFQVRAYLADTFLNAKSVTLAADCAGGAALFNPASCAPDFTKNYNISAIALQVPIASMGATVFDTWSTISISQ